jgi:hypothetical protein
MYFALFCGLPDRRPRAASPLGLRRREAWPFIALVATLVAFGLAPRALVDSQLGASAQILLTRPSGRAATLPGH